MNTVVNQTFLENVVLQEYLRACADVRSLEANGDRLIGVSVTLFALATTVGIEKHVDLVFVALPAAVIGAILYTIMLYIWIFSLCGYKEHLERVINDCCGSRILIWEALVARRESMNLARRGLIGIYLAASLGMIALSLARVLHAYGRGAALALGFFCVICLVISVAAWRQRASIGQQIYKIARTLYASGSLRVKTSSSNTSDISAR